MRSYDPTLAYDPSVKLSYSGGGFVEEYRAENSAGWAKLDVVLTAIATHVSGTADLFNYLRSSSIVTDADVLGTESTFTVGTGAQVWNDGTDQITVTCTQLPWRSLFEALGVASIHIALIRMIRSVAGANQFGQSLTVKKKTFLGGKVENDFNPAAYLSPDQFQTDRVDIPIDLVIDAETGLYVPVVGNSQVVTLSLFIDRYKKTYGGASLKA